MGGAVVHDPENATCRLIELSAHDFPNQAIDRSNAGFLSAAAERQSAPLPNAIIQIEDASSLGREIWIAWEDRTAMSPRAQRIGTEPAPPGRSANLSYQPLCDHLAPNLGKSRESVSCKRCGEFTGAP
jgi:hypothetical protein